jgi:hypothetical protein
MIRPSTWRIRNEPICAASSDETLSVLRISALKPSGRRTSSTPRMMGY